MAKFRKIIKVKKHLAKFQEPPIYHVTPLCYGVMQFVV